MGATLSSADAQELMKYVSFLPSAMSACASVGTVFICIKIERNTLSSRIVVRLGSAIGLYSFVNCFSPQEGGWSHVVDVYAVTNSQCYLQSVVLIALENMTYAYQCALVHSIYQIVTLKSLRPDVLLACYDTSVVVAAFLMSLVPWALHGYGWLWYGRCKYNQYYTGFASKITTSVLQTCCIIYVLAVGIQMRWAHYCEMQMLADYRLEQAIMRHKEQQRKYILLTWVWVCCRSITAGYDLYNAMWYLSTQEFTTVPDDVPIALLMIETLSTELLGVLMLVVIVFFDWRQIWTYLLRFRILGRCYCINKEVDYNVEPKSISSHVISTAVEKEVGLQEILRQYPFECFPKGESGELLSMPSNLNPASPRSGARREFATTSNVFFKEYNNLDSLDKRENGEAQEPQSLLG